MNVPSAAKRPPAAGPSHREAARAFAEDFNALELPSALGVQTIRQAVLTRTVPRRAGGARTGLFERASNPPGSELATLHWTGERLAWDIGAAAPAASPHAFTTPARRAAARVLSAEEPPPGEVVQQLVLERLEPSKVGAALAALDRHLTPGAWADDAPGLPRGPREWRPDGRRLPLRPPAPGGKKETVLLFIHGTFSRSEAMLEEGLRQSAEGREFLALAAKRYDRVLVFDHPTLSVGAAHNALDLARELLPLKLARLDIVAHSRGGLVARWLCEVLGGRGFPRRAVLVGSPLAGTSLAAAPNARAFFDYLTNVGHALSVGATLLAGPWMAVTAGLLQVLNTFLGGLARLPVADAVVALVPGLQTQARIGNNEDLARLRRAWTADDPDLRYFVVRSDFQPASVGWNVLKYFRQLPARALNAAADRWFGDQNDLVVDTRAMTDLAEGRLLDVAADILDFGTTGEVHHCNYFDQPATATKLRAWLL